MASKYRPEIDGLRAIAVIAVLLYHAEFTLFNTGIVKGGFLGVDVFFVLSGYLLTGVIANKYLEGTFKLRSFYYNRIKRLLPALFTVFVATLPFAFSMLLLEAAREYAISVITAVFSVSNIFFWQLDSYIAEPSAYKPFLHTWSLAVEEQFYFIFPLAVILVFKYFRAHVITIALIVALASLFIAQHQSSTSPDTSFYLLHTRFWELLAGSIIALIEIEKRERVSTPLLDKTMPTIGLFLIIYAFVFFDDTIKHPSFLTLLPVLGTMILIWFSKQGEAVFNLITSKLFVFVGLISYSLYLWHWPVLVFYRIHKVTDLSSIEKLLALAVSVVLATLTYYIIETPFRRRFAPKIVFAYLFVLLMVIFSACWFLLAKPDTANRETALQSLFERNQILQLDGPIGRCQGRGARPGCQFKYGESNEHLVLIGDSHAGHILDYQFNERMKVSGGIFSTAAIHGCAYIGSEMEIIYNGTALDPCNRYQRALQKWLVNLEPATLVISGRYPFYLSGKRFDNKEGGVEVGKNDRLIKLRTDAKSKTIDQAFANAVGELVAAGHRVVLVYPIPEVGVDVAKYYAARLKGIDDPQKYREAYDEINLTTSYKVFKERTASSYTMLDAVSENVIRVYPEDLLCSKKKGRCFVNNDRDLLYFDDDHLAPPGADLLVDHILEKISKAKKSSNKEKK